MIDEKQKYCYKCGSQLTIKEDGIDGKTLYCETCKEFHYPFYNVAVSMIVLSHDEKNILLIKQYKKDKYILVAGYVNIGEEPSQTIERELQEETSLNVKSIAYNSSHFFKPSNTLMLNYIVIVQNEEVKPNQEIDSYKWFNKEEAKERIAKNSLAEKFLLEYLNK